MVEHYIVTIFQFIGIYYHLFFTPHDKQLRIPVETHGFTVFQFKLHIFLRLQFSGE